MSGSLNSLNKVMRSKNVLTSFVTLAACLLVLACQSSPRTSSAAATASSSTALIDRSALEAAWGQCTTQFGYDPAAQAALAEDQLGTGELEWRGCAYDALIAVVRPELFQPEGLDALVETDKRLTQAIANGTTTRTERLAQITAQVEAIKQQEQAVRASIAAAIDPAQDLSDLSDQREFEQMRSDMEIVPLRNCRLRLDHSPGWCPAPCWARSTS